MELEKKKWKKPKVSRRQEIINIRAYINEMVKKKKKVERSMELKDSSLKI